MVEIKAMKNKARQNLHPWVPYLGTIASVCNIFIHHHHWLIGMRFMVPLVYSSGWYKNWKIDTAVLRTLNMKETVAMKLVCFNLNEVKLTRFMIITVVQMRYVIDHWSIASNPTPPHKAPVNAESVAIRWRNQYITSFNRSWRKYSQLKK